MYWDKKTLSAHYVIQWRYKNKAFLSRNIKKDLTNFGFYSLYDIF
jgi:hypothetical protein